MEPDLVTPPVVGDDCHEHPRGAGPVESDLERSEVVDRSAAGALRTGSGVIGDTGLPVPRNTAEALEHTGSDHVQHGVTASGEIAPDVAGAVVDREGIARHHLRGNPHPFDLQLGLLLFRLLVHQVDREVEVGSQGLVIALQVGGGLDEVAAGLQVLVNAGVAEFPAVVVGSDDAARHRRQ